MKKVLLVLGVLFSLNSVGQSKDSIGNIHVGECVLETTVMTSSAKEFEMIGDLIANSPFQQRVQRGDRELVLFFNDLGNLSSDTVLVRIVYNINSDETYKVYVK
jgi:hypothetical protein